MSAPTSASPRERVVILGAAGRDFHDFNILYRDDPTVEVVAFTAAQIPDIDGRTYPPALAGGLYPRGIRIVDESALEDLVAGERVDTVVLAYSDLAHTQVMHLASRAIAAGADIVLPGARRTMLRSRRPVVAVTANGAVRTAVKVGDKVELVVRAEAPPAAGKIIAYQWDFDGSGLYPEKHRTDGASPRLEAKTSHSFDKPGTYFVTALVESHRDGDVDATTRRVPNLASARVVVS